MKAGQQFQFVANQPAVDFANTVIRENGSEVDLLKDFSALSDWLVLADIVSAKERQRLERRISGAGEREALLREARTLRSAMLTLVNSATERKRIPESVLSEINRVLASAPTRRRVVRTAAAFEVEIDRDATNSVSLLAPIAESAAELLAHGDLTLIRKCENPDCILHIYDTTKNHRRRWCSMASCGNRNKVERFRERDRAHASVVVARSLPKKLRRS